MTSVHTTPQKRIVPRGKTEAEKQLLYHLQTLGYNVTEQLEVLAFFRRNGGLLRPAVLDCEDLAALELTIESGKILDKTPTDPEGWPAWTDDVLWTMPADAPIAPAPALPPISGGAPDEFEDDSAVATIDPADEAWWAENAPTNDHGPAQRVSGVRLDANEEAAIRYNLSPDAEAQREQDWQEYNAWSAAMSRWVNRNEPGPQPY